MSNYNIGAYEALQWAWKVLRENEHNPESISEAKKIISDEMVEISEGKQPKFSNSF
jgi:hypothetical protein